MVTHPPPRHRRERAIAWALLGCALVPVLMTLALLWWLLGSGVTASVAGLWPLLAGSLLIVAIALAVALPLGLLAAIHLAEFADRRQRRVLEPTFELLAVVPTIALGYAALLLVTPLLQRLIPGLADHNALSPGIVVGLMLTPTIAALSAEAIRAVPRSQREAAWALGIGELRTLVAVVLPAAAPGIAAALALALSRAIGETMIVTLAAGARPLATVDPRVPIETLTAAIVEVAVADPPADDPAWRTVMAAAAALLVLTVACSLLAQGLARLAREAQT